MEITDLISITELSRLTNKSRPTIYKYITDYNDSKLDNIPYTFITLFNNIKNDSFNRNDCIEYCKNKFGLLEDEELNELLLLIKNNKDIIDIKELRRIIEEEIKNERNS